MNRRDLSGIYIFHKFEDEERREPTCFEDCPEEKQDEWLNSLQVEALKNLAKQLGKTLRTIGDTFDLAARSTPEYAAMGSLSSLLTKKQDNNMNEEPKKQEDTEKHLLDKLPIGDVISSVCTCKNAELEKDSLVPVYCHNCNAYVQTDL